MRLRLLIAAVALAGLAGCATYSYSGGNAGYYRGAPSVQYRYPAGYYNNYGYPYYGSSFGLYGYGYPYYYGGGGYYRPYPPAYRPGHRPPPPNHGRPPNGRPPQGGHPPQNGRPPDRPPPTMRPPRPDASRPMPSPGSRQPRPGGPRVREVEP